MALAGPMEGSEKKPAGGVNRFVAAEFWVVPRSAPLRCCCAGSAAGGRRANIIAVYSEIYLNTSHTKRTTSNHTLLVDYLEHADRHRQPRQEKGPSGENLLIELHV